MDKCRTWNGKYRTVCFAESDQLPVGPGARILFEGDIPTIISCYKINNVLQK